MAIGKTFIIPTVDWYDKYPLWFQNKNRNDISNFSEWYRPETSNLFLQIQELEELPSILSNKKLLADKGRICKEWAQNNARKTKEIFSSIINRKEN